MRMIDVRCACGTEFEALQRTDESIACRACGGATTRVYRSAVRGIQKDSIEGGLVIEHGLCNEDGTPRTYYSRSEINLECAKRGLVPWYQVRSEDTPILKDARVKDDWQRSGEARRLKRQRDEARQEKYLARDREAARMRA